MTAGEIARALDAALALGLLVFPLGTDKRPTCPRGFLAAVADPADRGVQDVTVRESARCVVEALPGDAVVGLAAEAHVGDVDERGVPRDPVDTAQDARVGRVETDRDIGGSSSETVKRDDVTILRQRGGKP